MKVAWSLHRSKGRDKSVKTNPFATVDRSHLSGMNVKHKGSSKTVLIDERTN